MSDGLFCALSASAAATAVLLLSPCDGSGDVLVSVILNDTALLIFALLGVHSAAPFSADEASFLIRMLARFPLSGTLGASPTFVADGTISELHDTDLVW